jgi:tRNA(adenine34) deaminase
MDRDEAFMGIALDLARQALLESEVPVGAVLVVDGKIVGRGRNRPIGLADPSAHAEILALREAAAAAGNYRLPGSVLYSTVEPCLMCLGAIFHARVGRLVYGASDPKVGATSRVSGLRELGADISHHVEIEGGIQADRSAELLLEFFRGRRSPAVAVGGYGEVPKWS